MGWFKMCQALPRGVSGSAGTAGPGAWEWTCQGISGISPGLHRVEIPPWVGTDLPKGRSWELSVCSCCSWDQPWDQGAMQGAHTVCCQASLCLEGSKILVNNYESNTISDFRNKIHVPQPTLPGSRPCGPYSWVYP